MKALKDLLNWLKDTFWGWIWGHVYQVFIPILIVSAGGLLSQLLNMADWVKPETDVSEYVQKQSMLAYDIVKAYGIVSDYASLVSLIMIVARLFRDGFSKLARMLNP